MMILNFFKKIILFIIKEFFSFFIKLFLFIILITIIISGVIYSKKERVHTKEDIFIKINLADNFPEQKIGIKFLDDNPMSFYELIDDLEEASEDKRVEGLILNLENTSLNMAQIEEMGKILSKFKDNKKTIYSYAENINKNNFYLASYTDSLYMPESHSTTVNIYPYFSESFYVKDFIDKFGIKFNIINIGDYKSFQENLAKNFMSKENREDKTRILENKYQEFLKAVSKNLNLDKDKFSKIIENGDLVASSSIGLYQNNLLSNFSNLDEIENLIGKENIVSIHKYNKNYVSPKNKKNKIYVLTLEGEMGAVQQNILGNISYISANKTIKILDKVAKDDSIKAIILRVNSPGGSALVADKISKKIKEVAKIKPIYTSMGGVAASGGYYISANTNKIFVDKNTITGSIGVISIVPEITETLKKLNINNEKIIKGKYADLYSSTDFTEDKYEKIKNSNLKVYDDFLKVVSEGRKIDIPDLEKIAGGRIWTGEEAIKIGLADKIGGLKDTIKEIAKDNNIENYSIILSEEEFDLEEILQNYSNFIRTDKVKALKSNAKSLILKDYLLNKPLTYYPYEI
ncbi:MAG: signal peptide peptidase SppA [Fusobacterium sp.]|nr:signal peptide peptidase SppA [Fusobacterium sp.]